MPGQELAKTRAVHARHAVQLLSSNVLSNRHEMSDFEGLGIDDVELLTATKITEQLLCEWRAHRNRLCLEVKILSPILLVNVSFNI